MKCFDPILGLRPLTAALGIFTLAGAAAPPQRAVSYAVDRFPENPIIRPEMIPKDPVININGPSLIRVPAWLPHRLGNYYLYFANHRGPAIHLAVADNLHGPWKKVDQDPVSVFDVAALNHEVTDNTSHAASPDVCVDEDRHEVRMYFHFKLPKLGHVSTVAVSKDGLHFSIQPGTIGEPYLRSFHYQGWYYLITRSGTLLRSKDGLHGFETGSRAVYDATHVADPHPDLRHTGLYLHGDTLDVFFTRVGDSPESIYVCRMSLDGDWRNWRPGPPSLVLAPAFPYEGSTLPVTASKMSDAQGREHAVRDPYVFQEDGHAYLLYSVAGESGIAIAALSPR